MLETTLPMYAMEPLPPAIPPWWAFWRKPEERWQVLTENGTLGPLTRAAALEALGLVEEVVAFQR